MHEEIKGGFHPPFSLCADKGEVKRRRLLLSFQAKCGYWILSLKDVQPFSVAKTIVGSFCLRLKRVMYIRQLSVLIRFREVCNAIAQELTHPGAVGRICE